MNITFCLTSDYEQKPPLRQSENKPNSNPIKPNLRNVKMNLNPVKTKEYVNGPHLRPLTKQTQSKPIQTQFLTLTAYKINYKKSVATVKAATLEKSYV